MSNNAIFHKGHHETLKGVVHLALFGLTTAAQLYNAAAWLDRKDKHLAVNVLLYTGLACFEAYQVVRHIAYESNNDV